MEKSVCDGCWVQGDGPHACEGQVRRPNAVMSCTCGVDMGCHAWRTGDDFPATRWRFDRA